MVNSLVMKILGIDPGTARIGWACIDSAHIHYSSSQYGCITTEKEELPEKRLHSVYTAIVDLIHTHKPEAMSVEELFFSTNVKTAIAVAQARGVILLAAASTHIPVFSYTPNAVKQTICGYGKADKKQIQRMVKAILSLDEVPKPDDTADAIAIALTHAYSYKIRKIKKI